MSAIRAFVNQARSYSNQKTVSKLYGNHERMMIVGDDSFSFSVGFCRWIKAAGNVTTSTEKIIGDESQRRSDVVNNLKALKEMDVTVLRQVHPSIMMFDSRVNHTAYHKILFHQPPTKAELLMFLQNAKAMTTKTGEIHVYMKGGVSKKEVEDMHVVAKLWELDLHHLPLPDLRSYVFRFAKKKN